jgi:diadenylate cyclase
VGDDADVLSICTGGFLLDAEFTPQRLSELAKLDGAIIVSADASRIARANVHLMPNPSIPTTETGTRHRTAERMARSIAVPVISVSASMGVVTVYRGDAKHVLQSASRLHERIGQALQTLERFRQRLDAAVGALSSLEIEDTVTLRDVTAVLQPAELAVRIADEIDSELMELGDDARLLRLQLEELLDGVAPVRRLVVRDYMRAGVPVRAATGPGAGADVDGGPTVPRPGPERALQALGRLTTDELLDTRRVAATLGLAPGQLDLDTALEPRGYRLLHRLPRFPEAIIDGIVEHFVGLQKIMRASIGDLEEVAGVGEARAKSVKDGLARLAEATILDRYS